MNFNPYPPPSTRTMTAYIKMWGTRGIKSLLMPRFTHWTTCCGSLIHRLCNARPGCIPSGCWHRSNRPDKKDPAETTRHWQPFNTAEQADTHSCAHTNAHPLRFAPLIQPPALWHTPHIGRQDSCQLSSHHAAARLDYSAELPSSLFLIALALCHSNWLSGLQYPSFPAWVTGQAAIQ